jgi:hypothetical protein
MSAEASTEHSRPGVSQPLQGLQSTSNRADLGSRKADREASQVSRGRRRLSASLLLQFVACGPSTEFTGVHPDYGYTDGCTYVSMLGTRLGPEPAAFIGGEELPLFPTYSDASLRLREFYGVTPPAPEGPGTYDVLVVANNQRVMVRDVYTYVPCPASFRVELAHASPICGPGAYLSGTPEVRADGDCLFFDGCGLSEQVTVRLMQYLPAKALADDSDVCGPAVQVYSGPLNPTCETANATFTLPKLPNGTYAVWLEHEDGTVDDGGRYDPTADATVCDPDGFTVVSE